MFLKKPKKLDIVEKVKINVGDLKPGMFICELDRPWLETPFLLQGFEIKDDSDIEAVMRYCKWVYIDMLRTQVHQVIVEDVKVRPRLPDKSNSYDRRDLLAANKVQSETSFLIKNFVDDIRLGQCPDIQLAKAAVGNCVSSVIKNPDAMMFLAKLKSKGESNSQHAFNVCIFSLVIGRLLGLESAQLENLGTCALLHDMGKIALPDSVLNKQEKLTQEEMELIRSHPKEGRDILMSGRNIFSGCVDVAYGHHETLDGSGYPRGLEGHQLNLNCKIVSITDKYDAITSFRPHRPAGDHLRAVAILNKLANENKIDAKLTSGFFSYLGVYPPGSIVELNTGEVGIVIDSHPEQRLRPQLLLVRDTNKQAIQQFVDMTEKRLDSNGKPYRITSVKKPGDYNIDLIQYSELIMQAFE